MEGLEAGKLGLVTGVVTFAFFLWDRISKGRRNIGDEAIKRYKQERDLEEQRRQEGIDKEETGRLRDEITKLWKRMVRLEDEAIRNKWEVRRDD